MTHGIEIRAARMADLPLADKGLRALAAHLGDGYAVDAQALAEAAFGPAPSIRLQLALGADGDCLGVVQGSPVFSTMQGGLGLFVSDLWVSEAARGAGLGRRLLAAVCRDAAAHWGRPNFVRLMVHRGNLGGAHFYERLGFRRMEGLDLIALDAFALERLGDAMP